MSDGKNVVSPRQIAEVLKAIGSLIAIAQFGDRVRMPSKYENLSDWIKDSQNVVIDFLDRYF